MSRTEKAEALIAQLENVKAGIRGKDFAPYAAAIDCLIKKIRNDAGKERKI